MSPSVRRSWLFLLGALAALTAGTGRAATGDISVTQFQQSTWTAKDGAPADVWTIAQTNDGWLWFGGPNGLYRFDGVRFRKLALDAHDANRSNAVSGLFALPSGELLIGRLSGGVSVLQKGKLTHYDTDQTRRAGSVLAFAQDAEGALWAPAQNGLLRFDGREWQLAGNEWNYPGGYANTAMVDAQGTLWIATRKDVLRLQRGSRAFDGLGVAMSDTAELIQSTDGRTWYADDNGVHLLPGQSASLPRGPSINSQTSYRAMFDDAGYYWNWWNPHGAHLPEPVVRDVASLGGVKTIMQDREGNIWFGSTGDAVHRLRRMDLTRLEDVPVVAGMTPWIGFAADKLGNVWMGMAVSGNGASSADGMWKFDGRLQHVQANDLKSATAISVDANGTVWAGGLQGLWRLDGSRFVNGPVLPEAVRGEVVRGVSAGCDGGLWVSAQGAGLLRYDGAAWQRNGNVEGLPTELPGVQLCDSAGQLWLGYGNGKVVMVAGSRATSSAAAEASPKTGSVKAISVGRNTLAGGEQGLALLHNGTWSPLKSGVPGVFEGLTGIVEARNGDIWLNGARGAAHITSAAIDKAISSPTSEVAVELFDSSDGYPAPSYSIAGLLPTITQASDERIWLAGHGGIAWIDPARLRRNVRAPPIVIEALSAGDARYEPAPGLSLAQGTRNLQVDYTALGYAHPDRLRFRYRLEGVDDTWVDAGPRRQAFYSNLGPGAYRFQVDATNENGVWSDAPASVEFAIPPTFVQSTTFIALCVVAAAGLMLLLYRMRVRQLTARERSRHEERLRERERIARELHDTLLQSVQGLILKFHAATRSSVPEGPARASLERALQSAEDVMTEGRERIQELRSHTEPDGDLAKLLAGVGAEGGDDQFRVVVEGSTRLLSPPVTESCYRIGREALRNAFRHAHAHAVEARLNYGEETFRLLVRDDGVGVDTSILDAGSTPGHWGLKGMQELAAKMGARLDIRSRPQAGTDVELTVPAAVAYRGDADRSRWQMFWRAGR